ncbi:MAG: type II toxin-antitoxin system RelE/ParE family toxin [Hyphomicrobiales bacterium]|nr:type II toxin-antitoxin system RelE/ParE family toxin [Hyphomicrobiales bacterium]MBV9430700.1 type II toxin-antitoxin system RelE/ParE family toxin [Hyphomicrobiales bacterium]
MIRSFRSRALRRYWLYGDSSRIKPEWQVRTRLILSQLDVAQRPNEMNLLGLRFHALTGDQRGRFAVLVSRNWRVTFAFEGEDAVEIDMEDYHG